MTDATALALLRAIITHPHQDTPRLVYADWLDEHGRAERAEFIRVQVELARCGCPCEKCRTWGSASQEGCLVNRERELLTDDRRREWARVPCPNCEGTGEVAGGYVGLYSCPHCGGEPAGTEPGTGDAMQRAGCIPHYRRGFVERIEVPSWSWVFDGDHADWTHRGTVTDWALAVAAAHPVTEVLVRDLQPQRSRRGDWYWSSADLPLQFWERCQLMWASRKAAEAALATAAADLVRDAVREMWVK